MVKRILKKFVKEKPLVSNAEVINATSSETKKSTRTCFGCKYSRTGIPCGHCTHPEEFYMPTSDTMVFFDAGPSCPLNKRDRIEVNEMNIEKILADMKFFVLSTGIKGAVVGISGGKDSTIVAKLMVDILGKDNVLDRKSVV